MSYEYEYGVGGYDPEYGYYLGADATKTPLDDPGMPSVSKVPTAAEIKAAVAPAPATAPAKSNTFVLQSTRDRAPALTVGPAFVPSDLPPRRDESKSPVSIFMRDDLVHGVPNAAVVGGGVVGTGLLYALYRALTKRSV